MPEKIMSGMIILKYIIRAHNIDGKDMYDWELSTGDSSFSLFTTAEEAVQDVRSAYS